MDRWMKLWCGATSLKCLLAVFIFFSVSGSVAGAQASSARPMVLVLDAHGDSLYFEATGAYEIHWSRIGGEAASGRVNANGDQFVDVGEPGRYRVEVFGSPLAFRPTLGGQTWVELSQWGDNHWLSFDDMLSRLNGLEVTANDSPRFRPGATMEAFLALSDIELDVSEWDVGNVVNLAHAFTGAAKVPAGIENWDVSNVTDMEGIFRAAGGDIPSLANWDVAAVENFSFAFAYTDSAEIDLRGWDFGAATNLSYMFLNSRVRSLDLADWDVDQVVDMSAMFAGNPYFNEDLSGWSFDAVADLSRIVDNTGFSTANYDRLLVAWAESEIASDLFVRVQEMRYCEAGDARQRLIADKNWQLSGDGKDCRHLRLFDRGGVDFGVHLPGSSLTERVELVNLRDSTLALQSVELISQSERFSLIDDQCSGRDLSSGQRCALTFTAQRDGFGLYEAAIKVVATQLEQSPEFPVTIALVEARPDPEAQWSLDDRNIGRGEVNYLLELFDMLSVFYFRLGGENWVNNDGWLDATRHPCEWYGVICVDWGGWIDITPPPPYGFIYLNDLSLADNNLTGSLTSFKRFIEIAGAGFAPRRSLDLRGNALTGVDRLPYMPDVVLLDNNGLSGALPPYELGGYTDRAIWHLSLAGNAFSGPVPESWQENSLTGLDVSENQFEGSTASFVNVIRDNNFDGDYQNALGAPWRVLEHMDSWRERVLPGEAIRNMPQFGLQPALNLAGNAFSMAVDWQYPFKLHNGLCWNEASLADDLLAYDYITLFEGPAEVLAACQGVERKPVSSLISGSWYAPSRDGEGMNMMLLEDGTPFAIWYMHAEAGRQVWMLGQGRITGQSVNLASMTSYVGAFGVGYDDAGDGRQRFPSRNRGIGMSLSVSALDGNTLAAGQIADFGDGFQERVAVAGQEAPSHINGEHVPYDPSSPLRELTRLTSLAGTSCDNQHEFQWVSGLWYEPESDGEGLVIEFTTNEQAVVYWYTYTPDGSEQAWMLGAGSFDGQRLVIENMHQPQHIGDVVFDTAGIEKDVLWGSLEIEFADENTAELRYDSVMEGYGVGTRQLTRLASPMLASCEAGMH